MESLYPISDYKMEWRSAAGVGRRYELHASRGVIADLDFGKKATKEAVGRTLIHTWWIKPEGPLGSKFAVMREGDAKVFSTLRFNLARTKAQLPIPGTARSFQFASTNFFGTDWQWLDEHGYGLMGLRQKGLSRLSAELYLAEHARQHPFTPLFFQLGFYLIYLNHESSLASSSDTSQQIDNLARSLAEQKKRAAQIKRSALLAPTK
jgi:hypothetical protein